MQRRPEILKALYRRVFGGIESKNRLCVFLGPQDRSKPNGMPVCLPYSGFLFVQLCHCPCLRLLVGRQPPVHGRQGRFDPTLKRVAHHGRLHGKAGTGRDTDSSKRTLYQWAFYVEGTQQRDRAVRRLRAVKRLYQAGEFFQVDDALCTPFLLLGQGLRREGRSEGEVKECLKSYFFL